MAAKYFVGIFPERVIPFEFFDDQLYGGPTVVKPPDVERSQFHIGHNNLIAVFAHREEGQLFRWVFWDETPYHHKAILFLPLLGLIHTFAVSRPEEWT